MEDAAEQEDEDETEGEGELLKSEVGLVGFVLIVLYDPLTFIDKKFPLLPDSFFNEKPLLFIDDNGGDGDLLLVALLIIKPDCFLPLPNNEIELLLFPGGLLLPDA